MPFREADIYDLICQRAQRTVSINLIVVGLHVHLCVPKEYLEGLSHRTLAPLASEIDTCAKPVLHLALLLGVFAF